MRILIIISQFHPAQTPNTLRWLPLANEFVERGHKVSILTTCRRGYGDKSKFGELTIYRTGYNTLLDKVHDVLNRKERRNELGGGTARIGLFSGLIQSMVDRTWRRTYWPDGSKLFLKPGIRKGIDLVKQEKVDKLISVGLPFTCHLIARTIKEQCPEVSWHMDIQDPFSYSREFWVNNYGKYHQKNLDEEKLAFEKADSVSVTNPRAAVIYEGIIPAAKGKTSLIPPLYTEADSEDVYEMYLDKHKTHLIYAGSFYDRVRSIEPFLKFLTWMHQKDPEQLTMIQIHILGQLDRNTLSIIDSYSLVRRNLVLHGFRSRPETLSALMKGDILLNFGNTTDYHLPSKVVDYLHLNKPILNLIQTEYDSTKVFFKDKPTEILSLLLSESYFQEQEKTFLSFVNKTRKKTEPINLEESEYGLKAVADKYLKEF